MLSQKSLIGALVIKSGFPSLILEELKVTDSVTDYVLLIFDGEHFRKIRSLQKTFETIQYLS